MKKFDKNKIRRLLSSAMIPALFLVVSFIATPISGLTTDYLLSELVSRLARNAFFVLALLLPVTAGMGINFGMTMGAMATQIALVFVSEWNVSGIPGVLLTLAIAIPLSGVFGYFGGFILNNSKGREMITSMVLGLFMAAAYQTFLLYVCGTIIPMHNENVLLSKGYGIRNTLMIPIANSIDNLWKVTFKGVSRLITVPVGTFLIVGVLCAFIYWFRKTKFGQNIRAVGQDMAISEMSGIDVKKNRIAAIIISTVLAAMGQIVFLQSIGSMSTYGGADQAALFAAAALLVGGASVSDASNTNAIIGTVLFHFMFLVMKEAGTNITGQAMIGEYLRSFICYGIITITLIMHAWKRGRDKELDRELLRERQN